jgi:hypothetical protein
MRTAQTQKRQFNLSCIEKHRWHRDFLQTGQLTNDLRRLHRHGQDACAQRQGQDRAGRERERQGSRLPHLRRRDRVWRGLEEDLGGRPRIPLGQARRPELPCADLRLAGRDRRRGRLCPRLVPPQPRLRGVTAAPRPSGGALVTRQFLSSRSTSFVTFVSALSRFRAALRRRASPVRRGSRRAHSQGDTTSRPSDCADHAQGHRHIAG